MGAWLRRYMACLIARISAVFNQDLSVDTLAWSLAFGTCQVRPFVVTLPIFPRSNRELSARSRRPGITGGVFPVPGATTLICIALTWYFRLNFAATQLANLLCTPLWFVLVLPFIRIGEFLFGVEEPVSASELFAAIRHDLFGSLQSFAGSLLHATVAWIIFTLAATPALYVFLRFMLHTMMPRPLRARIVERSSSRKALSEP